MIEVNLIFNIWYLLWLFFFKKRKRKIWKERIVLRLDKMIDMFILCVIVVEVLNLGVVIYILL